MTDPFDDAHGLIRRVYAYVAYRVGDGDDAEDVTSEAFERALRYRQSFDPDRGDAIAWLVGIARRVIADRTLRELPTDRVPEGIVDDHETRSLRRMHLARAVAVLDERDREILALRFGADLTAKEIARVLELRTNTVEVALHRALKRLRSELGEDERDARGYSAAAPDLP